MKKAILVLIAAFILGGAGAAQAQSTEEVKLGVNKSQKVLDRKVTIKVLSVTEDSRCPEGTECVKAGAARVLISVKKGTDESQVVELSTSGQTSATVAGYQISLTDLAPYPKSAAPIKAKDYTATINVAATGAATARN